jgi:A118 family predicted phage portal protein
VLASHLSKDRTYIQRHLLCDQDGNQLDGGKYVVYNELFDKDGNKLELPKGVFPEWRTQSKKPVYQIVTPNICNNIDIANPMGISVYANSIDDLKTIDVVYDSLYNEFNLGKKRIFVKSDVIKIDTKTGEPIPTFDKNDTVFYSLPGEDADKLITESDMELRVEDHVAALQAALDVYSEKCGLGKGYYKFDVDNVQTATAVVSQNSKLFRRVKKDEIILEKALIDMVQAILFLGNKGEADISVSFDDSIIEDTDAIANRAMREQSAGIIDDVEYFMITRDLEEEAAQELVDKIAKRRPPEPQVPDLYGGGA